MCTIRQLCPNVIYRRGAQCTYKAKYRGSCHDAVEENCDTGPSQILRIPDRLSVTLASVSQDWIRSQSVIADDLSFMFGLLKFERPRNTEELNGSGAFCRKLLTCTSHIRSSITRTCSVQQTLATAKQFAPSLCAVLLGKDMHWRCGKTVKDIFKCRNQAFGPPSLLANSFAGVPTKASSCQLVKCVLHI